MLAALLVWTKRGTVQNERRLSDPPNSAGRKQQDRMTQGLTYAVLDENRRVARLKPVTQGAEP